METHRAAPGHDAPPGPAWLGLTLTSTLMESASQVALWWAIWNVYDRLLLPLSPWPETAILCSTLAYCVVRDGLRTSDLTVEGKASGRNGASRDAG